jgi:hypothetical protein
MRDNASRGALALVPDSLLDRLAREIRAEHQATESAFESAVRHAHRCGQLLLEAKTLCGHGHWLPWLREVGIPARTATEYMNVARKSADPADLALTITGALQAVEDRERRERRDHLRALSMKFDRVMSPPAARAPDDPVRRYHDLAGTDPAWAWRRVEAHIRELAETVDSVPPPPKSRATRELRKTLERLLRTLGPEETPAP